MGRAKMRVWAMVWCGFALLTSLSLANAADEGKLELIDPGVLSGATDGSFAPFGFVDTKGNQSGLNIDLHREVVRRMGLKFNSLIVSWQGALPGLLAGKYDVLFQTMDITPDRQKNVLFVDAWLESGGRLVVHRDSPIKSVEDVKGKVIGVSSGSSWAKLAEPLGARELKYYETDIPAMLDVANMRTDAMICDQILAAYAIQERGLPLKMVGEYLTVVQKGWATRNHAVNLVKAMNKALASVIADGTYDKIAMKYVGLSPRPKSPIRSQLPN